MNLLTNMVNGLHGELIVPGDKSISHRGLLFGALSHGKTEINHFLAGEDCLTTLSVLRTLGVNCWRDDDNVIVEGVGLNGLHSPKEKLELNNSGTTTRLLMGILAGQPFSSSLEGDSSLQRRPMQRVAAPLTKMGAKIKLHNARTLPATIKGGSLHGIEYELPVASAQVKSAIMLAGLYADGQTVIKEKLKTRNHSELMLKQFGADISVCDDGETIIVTPGNQLAGQKITVPGDISTAAFWLVAATIIPHSEVTLRRVNLNPTRTGILDVLRKMGANVSVTSLPSKGEPWGNITVRSSNLRATSLSAEIIPRLIDELPLVALLAACADGTTTITGAEELRFKESDRIQTVTQELRKLGAVIEELPDGMIIKGQKSWQVQQQQLESYGDHRLGMMLAIAALRSEKPLTLNDASCVAVSYPSFWKDLAKLGGQAE